ncbi:hypothetical protein THTE_1385 [Thermogutta terrifontis]|uniref:Uncharacterized protein n=1 Tax=Thermogutta terrifontis TaxID=1331910 RepID=A0A286RDH1_9BACT|nr:hypothetical protein THTE_1385 [Thermogutta terrifontis]
MHFRMRALGRVNNFLCALVEHRVVVGFHADADNLIQDARHIASPWLWTISLFALIQGEKLK